MTERIGVGVVGAGYWGPRLARTFSALPDCEVRFICDTREGRLAEAAEMAPDATLTTHFEDVLNSPSVQAVAIATPAITHRELTEAALDAGKHVLVEKPMATSVADAESMQSKAATLGRRLAVGHVYLHHPAIAWLRTEWAECQLGNLCYGEFTRSNLGPPHSEVSVVWDLASHDISIVLGLAQMPPSEVTARGYSQLHSSLLDLAFITLGFPNGFVAQVHVSWLSPMKVRRCFVVGRGGSALFDDTHAEAKLLVTRRGPSMPYDPLDPVKSWDSSYGAISIESPELIPMLPLTIQCADFLDSIRSGRPPLVDGDFGLEVVRALEAADESIRLGGLTVQVERPPELVAVPV